MGDIKILIVSPEAGPFARTGGLGDVIAALPKALAAMGADVKLMLPHYRQIDGEQYRLDEMPSPGVLRIGGAPKPISVATYRESKSRVEVYFIGGGDYFDRSGLYVDKATGKDFVDNDERYAFFTRAALETVKKLNWRPDVIHIQDWQTALIPAWLKTAYATDPFFQGVKSVLTIHNLGYQGIFPMGQFAPLGLPEKYMYAVTGPFEFFGKVNFLKGGIVLADKITAVSPRYAQEITLSDEFGFGLEGVLRDRASDLTGILNGVDYAVWSPAKDKRIPYKFNLKNLSGKRRTKIDLLGRAKLPIRETAPLIGIISRLTDQKGWDLIAEAADGLFGLNLQMVVLGVGEKKYEALLEKLQRQYPDRLKVYLNFDDTLAHQIEAAADMFLMPSKYEPCGLNQLYSLRYGTVPIVHRVGGLADTVDDFDPATGAGTGFVFDQYTPEAMLEAIRRALALYKRKRVWSRLMKAGMTRDFSWENSARQYLELFRQTAGK